VRDRCGGISIEEKADLKRQVEIAHKKGVKVLECGDSDHPFQWTPDEVYKEAIKTLENGQISCVLDVVLPAVSSGEHPAA